MPGPDYHGWTHDSRLDGNGNPRGTDPIPGADFGDQWETFYNTTSPESILTNTATELEWVHALGSSLFDLSTPDEPAAIVAGIYAVSVIVTCASGVQSTGVFDWFARLTVIGDPGFTNRSPQLGQGRLDVDPGINEGLVDGPIISLSTTWHMEAGANVAVLILHNHGSSLDFGLRANVQRLA